MHRGVPENEQNNRRIADKIEKSLAESPDKGYRRIWDRYYGIHVNDKRVLRICRRLNIKSTIKYANHECTRQALNPQYITETILGREFTADEPNEKWLTDVTEFHYYAGVEKNKVYLSVILDLYDRWIASYYNNRRLQRKLGIMTPMEKHENYLLAGKFYIFSIVYLTGSSSV